ncbi:MAG: hypothetical protein NVSMB48_18240 [Marmoricola sp.]
MDTPADRFTLRAAEVGLRIHICKQGVRGSSPLGSTMSQETLGNPGTSFGGSLFRNEADRESTSL